MRDDDIVKRKGTIHYRRLLPRPNKARDGRMETSVCRSGGLPDAELWAICTAHFDAFVPLPAIGRGVARASIVMDAGLQIDPDGIPYREHANIVGWDILPRGTNEPIKNVWLDRAKAMAQHFRYEPRPQAGALMDLR
jgi:hypothetical protein